MVRGEEGEGGEGGDKYPQTRSLKSHSEPCRGGVLANVRCCSVVSPSDALCLPSHPPSCGIRPCVSVFHHQCTVTPRFTFHQERESRGGAAVGRKGRRALGRRVTCYLSCHGAAPCHLQAGRVGIETHLEDQRDERTRQYGEADEKGKTCEHTAGETRLDGRSGREETWPDGRAGWRRSAGRNDTLTSELSEGLVPPYPTRHRQGDGCVFHPTHSCPPALPPPLAAPLRPLLDFTLTSACGANNPVPAPPLHYSVFRILSHS
ncbi:hypothetical protein E2C01_064221 [Portunus trituberculatus]|uniref:Uncharacterized protein n=1 Tax=Portunus trituberculatus TaxID=210409 RepID=A0A5B7HL51_PORTR|nr:hypothetical protein [Portunus trituberculatus]